MTENKPSKIEQIEILIADARKAGTWLAYRQAARQVNELFQSGHATAKATLKTAFISSFTIDPLVDYTIMEAADAGITLNTYMAPYGQMNQEILNSQSGLYAFTPDVTILMAEADSLAKNPLTAADEIITLAQMFQQNTPGLLVVADFPAPPNWPLHLLNDRHQIELRRANQRLQKTFRNASDVQILDLDALAAWYGYADTFSPQMQAMARIPFAEDFLLLLAKKIVSHLKARAGLIRKCLVLDCDNTLWGGIIGEDGIDGIALGPDWPGREFVEFQKAVLELYEQGVILAINSKNNPADVLQVLREHPAMILREEHFASICINWLPKPENMQCVVKELNIGLDSLVFADDNPAEKEIMRQMLPEVAVLDLPENPAFFAKTLRQTNFFAQGTLTEEDKKRGAMYAAQRQRSQLQKNAVSLDDYLKSLNMLCSIRFAQEKDVKRAAQLTQRTNQFNLTTRRYTEMDIRNMLQSPDWNVYVLSLKDKFGDNGTVGLVLIEKQDMVWRIDSFLMSCRVIGRQAEEALADRICRDAIEAGAEQLKAEYIKTPKNALVADFWEKMHFTKTEVDENTTHYQLALENYKPAAFEYLKME